MKKSITLDSAKNYVESLVGQDVNVKVNRGRNKIRKYKGIVSEAHPNVFVVKLKDDLFDRISCTYTDIVCGNIYIESSIPSQRQ
ncbi:MAG: Veg family protein [Clostridia bacterium]|nr:Veg family protein [Clostridia bacterium]